MVGIRSLVQSMNYGYDFMLILIDRSDKLNEDKIFVWIISLHFEMTVVTMI